jgi:hypothetical protein
MGMDKKGVRKRKKGVWNIRHERNGAYQRVYYNAGQASATMVLKRNGFLQSRSIARSYCVLIRRSVWPHGWSIEGLWR